MHVQLCYFMFCRWPNSKLVLLRCWLSRSTWWVWLLVHRGPTSSKQGGYQELSQLKWMRKTALSTSVVKWVESYSVLCKSLCIVFPGNLGILQQVWQFFHSMLNMWIPLLVWISALITYLVLGPQGWALFQRGALIWRRLLISFLRFKRLVFLHFNCSKQCTKKQNACVQ